MRSLKHAAFAILMFATPALSGEVQDFEAEMRATYADYRNALFMTNMAKPVDSAKAIEVFSKGWKKLTLKWQQKPPPQYVEDPKWGQTIDHVSGIIDKALAEILSQKLPMAHETLKKVRDEFWDLHLRNDITSFSDSMNAYHLAMEHVLKSDVKNLDGPNLQTLREMAAVLKYLADDALAHPPSDVKDNAQFNKLAGNMIASVDALQKGVRAKDGKAVLTAVGQLKPAYSKLFLKFG